jgi:hypothetical protein
MKFSFLPIYVFLRLGRTQGQKVPFFRGKKEKGGVLKGNVPAEHHQKPSPCRSTSSPCMLEVVSKE